MDPAFVSYLTRNGAGRVPGLGNSAYNDDPV